MSPTFKVVYLGVWVCSALLTSVNGLVKYTAMGDPYSWNNANSSCTLATPRIVTSMHQNVTIGLSDHTEVTLSNGEELWLGYVQKAEMLQYVGCISHEHYEDSHASHYETQMDLGQCLTRCNTTTYIAILANECYCMNELPADTNVRRRTCFEECQDAEGVVCGGKTTVSIYKNFEITNPQLVSEHPLVAAGGNCVAYNGNSGKFTYTRCTYSFTTKCVTDAGGIVTLDGYKSWRQMIDACISNQMSPLDFISALKVKDARNIWTGLVKANKIYHNYDDVEPTGYGYVHNKNGEHYLYFEEDPSTKARGFLCQTEEEETTLTPHTDRTTVQSLKKAESNLLWLYILIPVLIILVLAILIFIFVRRRKRKGIETVNDSIKLKHHHHHNQNGYTYNNHSYLDAEDGFAEDEHAKALRRISQNSLAPNKAPPRRPSNVTKYELTENTDGNSALVATVPLEPVKDDYDHLDEETGKEAETKTNYDKLSTTNETANDDKYDNVDQKNGDDGVPDKVTDNEYAKINKMKRGNGHVTSDGYNVVKHDNAVHESHDVPGYVYDKAAF